MAAEIIRFVRRLAKLTGVALLPFVVFVKAATFLYGHERYPTALALAGGAAGTLAVVAVYAAWLWRRATGRIPLALIVRRVALPIVIAYAAYALLYLSRANAKSEAVRGYYASLHPVLRLALSTAILADRDLVVTGLARRPEDYGAMRLAANDGSLHYLQRDGWAHAADLRTAGRSEIVSRLLQLYFWSMGFATLRHFGTADHLHVELPLP